MTIKRLRSIAAMAMTIVAAICLAYGMFSIDAVFYFALGTIFLGVGLVLFGFLQEPREKQC